jgi:hypothetical protein
MKRRIQRILVVVAGATGVLGLLQTAAQARLSANHCEPLR